MRLAVWLQGASLCVWLFSHGCHGGLFFSDPQEQYRHLMPLGRDYPGLPPGGAERIETQLQFSRTPRDLAPLRLRFPPANRQSTGLYRVAGEPVTIRVRPVDGAVPDPKKTGLTLLIGAHRRAPSVAGHLEESGHYAQIWRSLHEGEQSDGYEYRTTDRAAGLLYIEEDQPGTGSFNITITGAVLAPWFKLGRDTLACWQNSLRQHPAPWAELEGQHAILTLPSAMIRDLDDPRPVIQFYDQVVRDAWALVGLSAHAGTDLDRAPDRPFRFVLDTLAVPYMAAAAGYPVRLNWVVHGSPWYWLTPGSQKVHAVLLHEMGHNHESVDSLLEPPGAEEAFANLLQYGYQFREGYWIIGSRIAWPDLDRDWLYAFVPLLGCLYDTVISLFYDEQFRHDPAIWVGGGYVAWSPKQVFMMHLVMHLSHSFIAELYGRFRHTPSEALPDRNNPQQKTDFFFELLCDTVHQDLTAFFRNWRVPVSPQAYERVANKGFRVPAWLRHDEL